MPISNGILENYRGELYYVVLPHTSQIGWKPEEENSLYFEFSLVVREWKRPLGTVGVYNIGDRALFEGVEYESTIDNNVWSLAEHSTGWKLII